MSQQMIKAIGPKCDKVLERVESGEIGLRVFIKDVLLSLIDVLIPVLADKEIRNTLMKGTKLLQAPKNQVINKDIPEPKAQALAIKVFRDEFYTIVDEETGESKPLNLNLLSKLYKLIPPFIISKGIKSAKIRNIIRKRVDSGFTEMKFKKVTMEEIDREKMLAITVHPDVISQFFNDAIPTNLGKRGPGMDLEGIFPFLMRIFSQKKFAVRNLIYRPKSTNKPDNEAIGYRSVFFSDVLAVMFRKKVINVALADSIPIFNELFIKYGG